MTHWHNHSGVLSVIIGFWAVKQSPIITCFNGGSWYPCSSPKPANKHKSMMGNYEMPHQMRQAASKSLILPVSLSLSHESFMRLDLCKSSSYLCIFSKAQPNRDFKREVCFFSSFFYTKLVFAYIFIREIATRVSQFLSSSSTLICWIVALCSFDSISLSWYPQYPLHILF